MQKTAFYGIIAAVAIVAGVGVAFASMSMNNNAANSQSTSSIDSSNDNVRVIKHLGGETEITGTPKRIVVVDHELAENLLALGAGDSIVGASLWKTYGTSFEEEMQNIGLSVPSQMVDVGDYWQPNFESIAQFEPDLIIISDAWNRLNYDKLNDIAPTLMFATYPTEEKGTTTLEEMEQSFIALAEAVNRQEEAATILDRFHAKLDGAADRIEAAGMKGEKFLVSELWVSENEPSMFLFTRNSVPSQILEKIGLQNALTTDERPAWGTINVGTEALASVALQNPDLHFFFGHYSTLDEVNYYNIPDMVKNDPIWKDLEFNKRGYAHELGLGFKPRPTPLHMEILVDKVLEGLH
jgi:ABC-type Fe3+-hydroxamate transport system substrate-binding protein